MLPIPCAYVAAAIALGLATPALDRAVGASLDAGVGLAAARDILTSTATGMIAFTGLVVSSVLVLVQFAASQYSPRLVLWFRRDAVVKNAIGSFLAAPLFALIALREVEHRTIRYSPDVTVLIGMALLIGAAVLFLILLQRVIDRIRPRSLYGAVARQGIRAIRAAFPMRLGETTISAELWTPSPDPRVVLLPRGAGVIAAFDRDLLVALAGAADVTIELVPGVGEFVSSRQPVLRVHGELPLEDSVLLDAVEIAEERTIELDPRFALRIIVDTAIRALSPAVNDPTTAVQAIDVLEVLARELGARDLRASLALDERGRVRLVWRAAGWEEMLELAFGEIRSYGAGSVQICRRLRAALEDLLVTTPEVRHSAIAEQLERLDATLLRTYPAGSPELELAARADRLGLGLVRA